MKRLLLLTTAIVTFFGGVTVSRLTHSDPRPFTYSTCKKPPKREFRHEFKPLRVSLPTIMEAANKRIPYDHYFAIVANESDRPIRWYVLGFGTSLSNIGASGFMDSNGFSYTYPDLKHGSLMPGETRMFPIKADSDLNEESFVWVDYLQFEDGSVWGPNASHTEQERW